MGKPTKRQSKKRYNYDINRKRLWRNSKKLPAIKCKPMKQSWDDKKSVLRNMADMGLSSNPNKTMHIKTTKELLTPQNLEEVDISTIKELNKKPIKEHVAQALEKDASRPGAKTNKLSDPDVQYCTYMLDKYVEDYKAMAKDCKNYYQDTPKQIKKKINMFKNTQSQYEAYLRAKT